MAQALFGHPCGCGQAASRSSIFSAVLMASASERISRGLGTKAALPKLRPALRRQERKAAGQDLGAHPAPMRLVLCLVVLCLSSGPAAAQIVPVWRIVTDVTGSICPLIKDGDFERAVRGAQAFNYRIDADARPTAEIAGSGRYVALRGRHFDTLVLGASDGVAWCAITLRQSTPQSVADAADPHLAVLGFRQVHALSDDRVHWSGDTGQASAFPVQDPGCGTTLAVRFTYAGWPEPNR